MALLALFGTHNLSAADGEGARSEIRVAVASNFLPTLKKLVAIYQAEGRSHVKIIAASTGKLYAQIIHGAPFDLFLSADSRRPLLLTQSGHAVASSRFTYALGKIALWSAQKKITNCRAALVDGQFKRLAIANPKTAPYGLAAQQALKQMALWDKLKPRLVRGENITQALHYTDSGNAQLGIVALSQALSLGKRGGCLWEIPTDLYEPIVQQAVLLSHRSKRHRAAENFMEFLHSARAKELIRSAGYGVL